MIESFQRVSFFAFGKQGFEPCRRTMNLRTGSDIIYSFPTRLENFQSLFSAKFKMW
jgi:hypothetical protein